MAKAYNLKLVVCTVGGVPVSGYGEDDAIGLEWDEALREKTVTADGQTIYSMNNNRGLTVTLTLSQKSYARTLLDALLEAQTGDNVGISPPLILPLPFALIDPSTGESYLSLDCVFITRPAASKGKTVGEVEYELHLPNPTYTPPVLNTPLT